MDCALKKVDRNEGWAERVQLLSSSIADQLREAISGRATCGIETQWDEDQAHYDGEDSRTGYAGMTKPASLDGSFQARRATADSTKSTVFCKITQPYVKAAAARVSDMLDPTDDKNWSIHDTPVPELAWPKQVASPQAMQGALSGMQQVAQPPTPAPDDGEQVQASDAARRASTVIADWLVQGGWHQAIRSVIESAARLGTGILKGPFPKMKRLRSAIKDENTGVYKLKMLEEVAPTSESVDLWNFFPDPACGESIQNGEYVFERSMLSKRQLKNLYDEGGEDGGYLKECILACIDEGPKDPVTGEKKPGKAQFEMWQYHGFLNRSDLELLGCDCSVIDGDDTSVPCIIAMVNGHIIKAAVSHLSSGEFPYDVMVWQKTPGLWAGVGVSRQMRECQRGVNAGVRNLMDNAGLSAGPQIIVDRSAIEPANGRWELTPRKVWWSLSDTAMVDMRAAFQIVPIETQQAELLNIVNFWLKQAEEVTGLPALVQGQQGGATQTLGGMTMLNNNATSVLRGIARTFDDYVTEPHIGRYYELLLIHGPDDAKGDFQIDARGSSALVERDLQNQLMQQLMQVSLNPAYGIDPELLIREILKSIRFDPKRLLLSAEKKQAMAQQAPPPPDPRLQVAQLNSQDKEKAMMADANEQKLKMAFDADQAERDRQQELLMVQFNKESGQVEMGVNRQNVTDGLKTKVGIEALKMKLQKELSEKAAIESARTPRIATPPNEPAGTAKTGEAYQA